MATLHRLIYCSKAAVNFKMMQIKEILNKASSNNRPFNISGVLLFNQNFFFQVIEGPQEYVEVLFDKIKEDNRHYDVKVIASSVLEKRQFDQWDMGFVIERPAAISELKDFIDNGEFNPYKLNFDRCFSLMGALKKELLENKVIATFPRFPE